VFSLLVLPLACGGADSGSRGASATGTGLVTAASGEDGSDGGGDDGSDGGDGESGGGSGGDDAADSQDDDGGTPKFDIEEDTGMPDCNGAGDGGGGGALSFSYIWIANSSEGTVSKIDT
jgi:hypothetical protein